ncbi:PIN-like domain-containing protein [Shewanella xiamenensis]|uniref:PIN-like domain-containing protein n=1 Tax=Shewanella xiamenensis TaxID=332186 RepID=A0ABT6UBJ5_9GAMM|nr:PIN-like domain-containing protein [Shewanella xiamenensis]MDI5830669.1 PIN-like domain-containing protein [Shewanella xiamenensis]
MKNQFRSFKKTTDDELKTLWENAIFVFDTNVLHSVYRYKASTCEDVLKLMEQLQKRVWIPYHVALEFYRNRLSVISAQHRKFDETRIAINKALDGLKSELAKLQLEKRHSHIDPNPLIDGINKLIVEYLKELTEQEKQCIKVDSNDLLLSRIESIFDKRVGEKPTNEDIQKIMDEGKARYNALTPPGYKDVTKEKDADNKYTYNGVSYEKQYGDLIVWKQIIDHAKKMDINYLIFVTDDNKEDWWEITQGKTTGFRTELIDEILASTDLKNFKAYSLVGFLTESKQYLNNTVSQDTIEDVSLTFSAENESLDLLKHAAFKYNNHNNNYKELFKFLRDKHSEHHDNYDDLSNLLPAENFENERFRNITIFKHKLSLKRELVKIQEQIEILESKISKLNELIENEDEIELKNTLEEECSRLIDIFLQLNVRKDELLTRLNSLE